MKRNMNGGFPPLTYCNKATTSDQTKIVFSVSSNYNNINVRDILLNHISKKIELDTDDTELQEASTI